MDRAELPPAFARALEADRSRYNALFAEARRRRPKLEPDVFAGHLRDVVAPIVAAVPEQAASRVTEVLFTLSLDLVGQEFLGPQSRYSYLRDGWRILLPRLARFVAEDPPGFAASVTNALYNLSVASGARPHEWAATLLALAELCPDAPTLLKAGQIAAWRAGLAHYRLPALEICTELSSQPEIVAAALSLPPGQTQASLAAMLDRLVVDPWLSPALALQLPGRKRELGIVARVGGFRGFGGPFITPPTVAAQDGHFLVMDAESIWLLTADVFGATLHRAEAAPADGAAPLHFKVEPDGRVWLGKQRGFFPEVAGHNSAAANSTTLALTTPLSHKVYLVAMADV